jgi:hypothetical protein
MRKSPTSQTEKAFVAFVQANQADTVLETVSVYAGGLAGPANTVQVNPSTLTPAAPSAPVVSPPSLMFTATNPEQINNVCGIYEMKLTACLATEIYDEQVTDAEDIHRERIEVLRDLLEPLGIDPTPINPPASGTDTRVVQNFTLSAIVYEDEDTKTSDNKIETEIYYYVCSCPADS